MKKVRLVSLLAISGTLFLFSCGEKTANTSANATVDSAFLLTTEGLGELRVGMDVKELEKVLGEKITLMNQNPQEVWIDSAQIKYRGEPATVFFDRRYLTDTTFDLVLGGIRTSGAGFKTGTGIGIGSGKDEIWNAYREGYIFNMYPDYEDSTFTNFSKTRSFIYVTTGEGDNAILFSLENDKVKMFELRRNYDDEE
jgi:hypothetical protein